MNYVPVHMYIMSILREPLLTHLTDCNINDTVYVKAKYIIYLQITVKYSFSLFYKQPEGGEEKNRGENQIFKTMLPT